MDPTLEKKAAWHQPTRPPCRAVYVPVDGAAATGAAIALGCRTTAACRAGLGRSPRCMSCTTGRRVRQLLTHQRIVEPSVEHAALVRIDAARFAQLGELVAQLFHLGGDDIGRAVRRHLKIRHLDDIQ